MNVKEKKIVFMFWLFTLFYFLGVCDTAETGDNSHVFLNFSTYTSFLDEVYGHLSHSSFNSSDKCQADTQKLLDYARNGDFEALKILDATGKPSSGVLEGGVFFIGYYSECVNTALKIPDEPRVHGQYCLLNLNFSSSAHQEAIPKASWLVLTEAQKPPTIGICIPSSCTKEHLNRATAESLRDNFNDVVGDVAVCHGKPKDIGSDSTAMVVLSILMLFVAIAVLGTVVDVLRSRQPSPCEEAMASVGTKSISTETLCDKDNSQSNYKNVVVQILLAFSMKRNALKIFNIESNAESIACLHGLKFLSMSLIILGHTYSFATQNLYLRNPDKARQAPKDFTSQLFANGTLAVDTFYFISGLLVANGGLKYLKKTNGKFPFFSFYIHRYVRLTTLMLAVIFFCAFILRYVGSGPNWLASIQMYDVWCKQNWWINALYLHNFIRTDTMCLSHTWYLATDMQFYLVVPLILIPLYRNVKWGFVVAFIFLFATVLATALITFFNHYPAIPYINNVLPEALVNAYYKDVYIKPYCRMQPFIVGIFAGYYLLNNKEKTLSKCAVTLFWTASLAAGLFVIYIMWPANQGRLPTDSEAAAYSSLARLVWAACLAWLTFACVYGYGGVINGILSWSILIPFSRLTYSAYLIHPVIMNVYYGCTETTVDFSYSFLLYAFLGNLLITYILSFFLSIIFESPFVALEKIKVTKKSS